MRRFERANRLARLDPDSDRLDIVGALLQYEFPWDLVRSLELALFRTYAVPTIGRLLGRTGEFTERTQRRYDDTQMLLYDLWLDGPKSPAGQVAAEHLNFIHGHYRISNDDFRYTLATFVVTPIRWLRAYGWRPLSTAEVDAWTNLMRDMGEAMHIAGVPGTYAEFETLLDAYEAEHFGYDDGGARVAHATLELMVSWYPKPLRPMLRRATPFLLDAHVCRALGLPVTGERGRRIAGSVVRGRSRLVRLLPPRRRPFLPKPRSYPNGYVITALGPQALLKRASGAAASPAAGS